MTAASAASCIAAEKAEPGSCQPNSAGTIRICAYAWQTDGLWERINFVLLQQARERGPRSQPRAG